VVLVACGSQDHGLDVPFLYYESVGLFYLALWVSFLGALIKRLEATGRKITCFKQPGGKKDFTCREPNAVKECKYQIGTGKRIFLVKRVSNS